MRCKPGARLCPQDQPQRGQKAAAPEQLDQLSEVRTRCGWCSAHTAALRPRPREAAIMRIVVVPGPIVFPALKRWAILCRPFGLSGRTPKHSRWQEGRHTV